MAFASEEDIDRTISALHAVKLIRAAHASTAKAATEIDAIADMLAMGQPPESPRRRLADAIGTIYGSRPAKPWE